MSTTESGTETRPSLPEEQEQEIKIDRMVEMGFTRVQSRHALHVCQWGIEEAVEYISKQGKKEGRLQYDNPFADDQQQVRQTVHAGTGTVGVDSIQMLRQKMRGDSEAEKQRFRDRLREEEAKRKKTERAEAKRQLHLLRQQIKIEKRERERQREKAEAADQSSGVISSSLSLGSGSSSSSNSNSASDAQVQIRLPDSTVLRETFKAGDTLDRVAAMIEQKGNLTRGSYTLLVPFPRREFNVEEHFSSTTLHNAGLAPRGSLTVQLVKDKGVIKKSSTPRVVHTMNDGMESDEEYVDEDEEEESEEEDERMDMGHPMTSVGRPLNSSDGDNDLDNDMNLLVAPDMWYLSLDMSKRANTMGASDERGRNTWVTLMFKPSNLTSNARDDAFKFLRGGIMSHIGNNRDGVRTTRSMNFELRVGRNLFITDDRGERHNAEIMVLTTDSLVVKVPQSLVPAIADLVNTS